MKVGRNAPCPCGSGRKFKQCCDSAEAIGTTVRPPSEYFLGYDARATEASPWAMPTEALVCMVFQVGREDLEEAHRLGNPTFRVGDWAISTGAHRSTVIHGPFPSLELAFDFGREHANAVRFMSGVETSDDFPDDI